jgi:RecB family endonuclease NucS
LISQQYRTDIGTIDILAKDKTTNSYIVIELKRNQTSDDTVGQLARYMGWISEKKNDKNVKGIIIASDYDKKLEYALKVVNNVEVFLYEVNFKLREFKGKV